MVRRNPKRMLWMVAVSFIVLTVSCGGGGEAQTSGGEVEKAAAKPATTPLDTALFSTVLPDDWEVMSDAIDKMKMMTLAEKGTGGKVGVYLKFEGSGNWGGEPMKSIQDFADKQGGTPAEAVTINGIEWAKTTYEAYGTKQTMYVTKHNGTKVTATILGDDDTPAIQAIMGAFKLK